ncbi:hypothetical protein CVT26_005982 [Gymnopilus dilepis]|uniref:F-box domain-containing protein n=1 Tax=Gymnopilus dilepis TaxID=231916 RepID=A0A409Y1S5_9AGAR|nr:hypothetical protein CVT26_005982 [Gymnopilus dilepis]
MPHLRQILRPQINGRLVPPEILETIFQMLLERQCLYVDRWPREEETMGVVTASHVCKFWRQVALNSPRLWARCIFPDFQNVVVIETFVKRARSVPLVVESDCRSNTFLSRSPSRFHAPCWLKVMNALRRIERLSITFDLACDDIRPLQNFVLKAAPLLHSCQISSSTFSSSISPAQYRNGLAEGSSMFDGNAKLLRCLRLDTSLLAPKACFSGLILTHLELDMDRVSSFHPGLCYWLDLLQGQALLEILKLKGFGLEYGKESSSVDCRDVSLPRLRYFNLEGEQSDCGELFRALTLPSKCYTFLEICEDETRDSSEMDRVQDGLRKLLEHWDEINGPSQTYQWSIWTDYDVLRFQVVASGLSEGDENKGVFTLHWRHCILPAYPFVLLLETLGSSVLVKRQAIIRLAHDMEYKQRTVASLFRFFQVFGPSTTELVLSGYQVKRLIWDLLEYPVTSSLDGEEYEESTMLLPNLKSVALVQSFAPISPEWDNFYPFAHYIMRRAERNYRVPVVRVECPYPDLVQPIATYFKLSNFTDSLMLCRGPSRFSEVSAHACPRCHDLF